MVANPIRFQPLDGLPDADERGAGTFTFDDGTSMVAEDPELASLVKSYQDTIPEAQNLQTGLSQVPDMRVASAGDYVSSPLGLNDPRPDDPIGALFGDDPFGDNTPATTDAGTGAADTAAFLSDATPYEPKFRGYIPNADAKKPAPDMPQAAGAEPISMAPGSVPPEPSDAQNAAELHRIAAQQALRGGYVQGRPAGWQDAQRTGRLDPEVAKRQGLEMSEANQGVLGAVGQSRQAEAAAIRAEADKEAVRLTVQRTEQERAAREAEEKRKRLIAERRSVNDAAIDTSFAQGDSFRQVLAVLGSALLGAVGSDAGLRMIESNIDRHVRKEMQIRGSKLQALAEEIGSEEQVIAGAKAKIYDLLDREAKNNQKNLDAAGIENQTPAVLAELKKRMLAEEQGFERESLGKRTEVYQQAIRGGRTAPSLDAAAKHYEAAAKLGGTKGTALGLEDMTTDQRKDFVARMQGLSDAEHSLNEIDRNVGIKRDAAGNVINRKELGNIEGAGFFGGRTPDEWTSEKGAQLSRERRRLVQAQVKAMSGAAATDVEREEYGKNIPLVDEKDLVNSTTEERRKWQKAYSDAVSLYGQERVDAFLKRKHGTQAGINMWRGQGPGLQSAEGQMLEIDE